MKLAHTASLLAIFFCFQFQMCKKDDVSDTSKQNLSAADKVVGNYIGIAKRWVSPMICASPMDPYLKQDQAVIAVTKQNDTLVNVSITSKSAIFQPYNTILSVKFNGTSIIATTYCRGLIGPAPSATFSNDFFTAVFNDTDYSPVGSGTCVGGMRTTWNLVEFSGTK